MVEAVPAPVQVVLWPLIGATLILALRRLLPNWFRRAAALATVLASLSALWSLRAGPAEPVTLPWEPINLFRAGPILQPGSLALFAGLILGGIMAALVLGIRGTVPRATRWHGLALVGLAGALLVMLAGNLLTLALGSGLLDLALAAMAVLSADGQGRITWRMAVPGAASTLLILASAVQMDVAVGTTSLAARDFPLETLLLVGVAGLLRLPIFPLHARELDMPEDAATLLLPLGAGIYLLARVQTIGAALAGRPWLLALGVLGLLAGGLLAWAGGARKTGIASAWSGIAVHQAGFALAYVLLFRPPVPWPWLGLALALATLVIWWAATEVTEETTQPRWLEGLAARAQPVRERVDAAVAARTASLRRWRESWLGQHAAAFIPTLALLSLVGAPLTAGAVARWPFYAVLLKNGQGGLLIATVAGDTLLTAGVWSLIGRAFRTAGTHRLKPGALLSLLLLALSVVAAGLASGRLAGGLGVKPPAPPDVSVWGLGFVFVLPWLLGAWLARVVNKAGRPLEAAAHVARLDWLYRAADQAGRTLAGAIYWVSNVGEGEGWWGWALIILAIGALFLVAY